MKKFIQITTLLLFFVQSFSFAQRYYYSIGSLGGTIQDNEISFTQSIGEIVVDSEANNSNEIHIGQGFSIDCSCDHIVQVQETIPNEPIRIYPNPSSNWIRVENATTEIKYFRLFDSIGNLITEDILENQEIDLLRLPKGPYVIQFFDKDYIWQGTAKIIKQ